MNSPQKSRNSEKREAKPLELNVNTVKELIESLDRSGLDTLHLRTEAFELDLERSRAAAAGAPAAAAVPAAPAKQEEPRGTVVKAPLVGTVYLSPSPDKEPFVAVGKRVSPGDVLFIIESMKLMNEVTSEVSGTVAEICVENGKTVEYGQPVMRIE